MTKKTHVPIRMCMGCRKKRKKEDMVRLVKRPDGVFLLNDRKTVSGRGYYLCPGETCLKLARRKQSGLESFGSEHP